VTSIVIPAHNEERVIGRLLDALTAAGPPADGPGALDVVVVCNGCTDATARAAARPGVTVVEIPVPSKHAALRAGDRHARGFPRVYVDADVEIDASGIRLLAEAVAPAGGVLAAAPARRLPTAGCAWRVRAYYRVWQLLPAVREGLFGRGVIALSEGGHARIADLPPLMADDLAVSLAFAPHERAVVPGAVATVHPPRTWADLIRRRVRATTSTHQLEQHQRADAEGAEPAAGRASTDAAGGGTSGGPAGVPAGVPAGGTASGTARKPPSARTSTADLRTLLLGRPWLLPHMTVFLAAAVVARRKARAAVRAGDYGTWLRDESSRTG
jgi:hypothetical protein